jgi:hypothetical protein
MAAGATYEPIATTTLSSTANSITFSSIAASWTDLRVVFNVIAGSGGSGYVPAIRFNSDTASNYSTTELTGNGTTAASASTTGATSIQCAANNGAGMSTTIPHLYTFDIFSYAGSTYKTALLTGSEDNNGSGVTSRVVGLWRSTSAITTITLNNGVGGTNQFAAGTIATLYGIKAA